MKFLRFSHDHGIGGDSEWRFRRLRRLLDEIGRELVAERTALRERHDNACADAAFALEALDNGDEPSSISADVTRLTELIAASAKRFAAIEEEAAFVQATTERLARLNLRTCEPAAPRAVFDSRTALRDI
ncbi:hypothetical protein [Aminobacter sp. HY435]|uniref:hypothetical protein n=1 Tax=Aminobacter sp. HY435 TaxID=2970917 RepID=UPI0022B9624F|nr:hypothetical protein [Aminobacter sp. HY435]